MKTAFGSKHKRMIGGCMVLYTAAYICRLNLGASLAQVTMALELTAMRGGLLQTVFAVSYAAGQFINGAWVDRVNPVRHMLLGLAGSIVCNAVLGMCGGYGGMLALCLLNGAFQSMLWTPIVRLIADHFEDRAGREKANLIISLTMIVGHLLAWAISGYVSNALSWRFSFLVPAGVCIPALLLGVFLLRGLGDRPKTERAEKRKPQEAMRVRLFPLLAASGFLVMLICSILFGFVRDGIMTWAPKLLDDLSTGSAMAAVSMSLVIPLINGAGIYLVYAAMRVMRVRNRRLMALVMMMSGCFLLPLLGGQGLAMTAVLLGCCCACIFGLAPVVTGLIPLEYDRENLVGLTAGVIDSFIYVGSALAGVCGGWIYDRGGQLLYMVWLAAALMGAACSLISARMLRRYRAKQGA